jgi:hypothetical protein
MIKSNSISFIVWENDSPLDIQLEPEAFVFTANSNEELTFVVVNPNLDFSWYVRHSKDGIQLFPETLGVYEKIELYRNGELTNELDFLFKE